MGKEDVGLMKGMGLSDVAKILREFRGEFLKNKGRGVEVEAGEIAKK